MKRVILFCSFFALMFLYLPGYCQEYVTDDATAAVVAKDLTNYINKDSDLKGGFFILDPAEQKVLNLKFDSIYNISKINARNYTAITYFYDKDANKKSIEFNLEQTWLGWQVTEIMLR